MYHSCIQKINIAYLSFHRFDWNVSTIIRVSQIILFKYIPANISIATFNGKISLYILLLFNYQWHSLWKLLSIDNIPHIPDSIKSNQIKNDLLPVLITVHCLYFVLSKIIAKKIVLKKEIITELSEKRVPRFKFRKRFKKWISNVFQEKSIFLIDIILLLAVL